MDEMAADTPARPATAKKRRRVTRMSVARVTGPGALIGFLGRTARSATPSVADAPVHDALGPWSLHSVLIDVSLHNAVAMTRDEFVGLLQSLADAWTAGDADGAAGHFASRVDYRDPLRYAFGTRDELVPFFEPPPGGHRVTLHSILFDPVEGSGAVEYTYEGDHRYHGTALVSIDRAGRIERWREWQHIDDDRDWEAFLART